jgi:teichuronic acid biosynthesis glycosyltransferase TuaH
VDIFLRFVDDEQTVVALDVVIVTYNSAEYLPGVLGSLPDWVDVVVVDNASSDNSAELARRAGVTVVANDVNAGFAAACNQGALLGGADFVLFLNPDALVDGENLEKLLRRMEEDPGIGVASPIIRHPDGSQQRERWPFPSAGGAWREALGLHRLGSRSGDDQGFVIGACFIVRRSVFTEAGGFDTRYWLYGEEADLCRRIRDGGWKIATVDDATAVHVGGASSEPTDLFIFEHFCRGGERFVADHAGMPALLSFRLANLLGSAVRTMAPGSRERRQLHQARLRRVLRQFAKAPFSVGMNSPASAARGHSIVVCSLEAWDDVWRRNQFLVRELLDADPHLRVLFVEPAFDRLHRLTAGGGGDRKRGLRSARPDGRLIVLEPVKTLPRVLGGFADWSLRRQVRLTVSRLGFDDPTLWVNDASYACLAQETGWSTLYDITDDWLRSSQTERARRRLRENEARLFSRAGAVVVCSADLVASRRQQRLDLELVPNAVDVEHFSRPQDRPTDLPKAPIAVYVGTLHEDRLDIDLIADLAGAIPNLAIVLVGPSSLNAVSIERLATHRNVTLLGPRPHAVVPAYLQHADIVIVPHIVSPFTESLDPIKAYECLAVGRPTVATPVAGFRALPSPVVVAERESFVAGVANTLARDYTVVNSVVPSWTERAVAFAGALRRARDPKSRRTSVVFVDHCAELSGGELSLVRLLPALKSVDVHVVLGEQGPLAGRLRAAGATVEVLELDQGVQHTRRDEVKVTSIGWRRLLAAGRDVSTLRRRLREISPDIIHTNSLKAAIYGGFAGRLAGVPVIWHIHDRIAPDYLPRQTVMAVRLLSKILPNEIIVNSRATGETLGPRTKYHVVPSPIAESDLRYEPADPATHARPFRVAMVGRLAPWKGQHVFLEAFARASLDGDAEAVIAGTAMFGEDDYAEALRDQAQELGIAHCIEFAGFVEDVPTLIRGVDVVVHASVRPEPFGQVVVEGMAASRAVIASAAGGPLEIITDGIDGILVPPGDSTLLAAALSRLAADPELRFRLGAAARERARAFSPDVVGTMVTRVYSDVLKCK